MSQEDIDRLLANLASGEYTNAEDEAEPAYASEDAGAASGGQQPDYYVPPVGGGTAPAARAVPKRPDRKYRPHDFKNPKLFSKEQIRRVEIIYDNYAKRMSSFISGKLRTECSITIVNIEEVRFYEYNNALPESIMMGVLETRPLEGNMLMEISEATAYLIIEKLLGWTGGKPLVSDGDFTDIEIMICEKFFIEVAGYLKEAWANVVDMEPRLDRIETNARLAQVMPLNEIVILVMFNVKMNDFEGSMSICVPCVNLAEFLDQAESFMRVRSKSKNEDLEKTKEDLFENLKASPVDVRGVLGNATLSLQDLLYLQVGDVVTLDSAKDSPITLRVGTLDWYQGEIGVRKNRMAVKITNELQAKKELQKIL